MFNKILFFFLMILVNLSSVFSQKNEDLRKFTKYDTLRGSLSDIRSYDVHYYNLKLNVSYGKKYISGSNAIHFTTTMNMKKL